MAEHKLTYHTKGLENRTFKEFVKIYFMINQILLVLEKDLVTFKNVHNRKKYLQA